MGDKVGRCKIRRNPSHGGQSAPSITPTTRDPSQRTQTLLPLLICALGRSAVDRINTGVPQISIHSILNKGQSPGHRSPRAMLPPCNRYVRQIARLVRPAPSATPGGCADRRDATRVHCRDTDVNACLLCGWEGWMGIPLPNPVSFLHCENLISEILRETIFFVGNHWEYSPHTWSRNLITNRCYEALKLESTRCRTGLCSGCY